MLRGYKQDFRENPGRASADDDSVQLSSAIEFNYDLSHGAAPVNRNSNTGENANHVDQAAMPGSAACLDDMDDSMDTEDMLDKGVGMPISSLTWEAYELCSDWNKSLKGDHGILAALDLSLPLPMCSVDISSPTKHRDILDIFAEVNLELPPYNMVDTRMECGVDERSGAFSNASCDFTDAPQISCDAASSTSLPDINIGTASNDLDRSNTLMTPQELERMPDQGLEFEQSVGPKNPPDFDSQPPPFIISNKGNDLTTITVMTSNGQKIFKVNTAELCKAASNMQPVIINANDKNQHSTLVMLPVSKVKVVSDSEGGMEKEGTARPKFKCLYCPKRFARSYKLRIHEMMKHTGDKPFPCEHPGCKWSFTDGYRLRRHQVCHQKVRKYECTICQRSFSTTWNLRTHEHTIHGPENLKYECMVEGCLERYSVESKLHKHMYMEHRDLALSFKCTENNCSASYYSRVGLERHVRSHAKRKELTCPIEGCNVECSHPSRLAAHIHSHTGERPYKCDFPGCRADFMVRARLNRHQKSHSITRQHVCTECGKSFHRLDHMKTHEFIHRAEKPYGCNEPGCKHRCTSMSQLRLHMKRHQNKKERVMLICPTEKCGQVFPTKHMLVRHINAHHPEIIAAQYLQDLPDHTLQEAHDNDPETMLATATAAAEASTATPQPAGSWSNAVIHGSELVGVSWSEPQIEPTAEIITAEVDGKQISLLVPNFQPQPQPKAPLQQLIVKTAKVKDLPKKPGKGSARTDSFVNSNMRNKANKRQELQRKLCMVEPSMLLVSGSTIVTNDMTQMEVSLIKEPVLTRPSPVVTASSSSIGGTTLSIPETTTSLINATTATTIASGMENWLFQDDGASLYNTNNEVAGNTPQEGMESALDSIVLNPDDNGFEEGELNLYDLPSIQ